MSLNKTLLALAFGLALVACNSAGLSPKDKVALACADVQIAGDVIAQAAENGQISKDDAKKAAALYHSTDRFCEPVAESITPADYAALLSAAAKLATQQKALKP